MRPTLRVLEPTLVERIIDEAMRVLATDGMEIRGPELRRRLLEHGLRLDAAQGDVHFPVLESASAVEDASASFMALSFSSGALVDRKRVIAANPA